MKYKIFAAIILSCLISSCANQLPPSGGEDDKIPPKIISIFPKPNSINFSDNKIRVGFDEYVDRRSFEESFSISPNPEGEYIFNWSGKEVEVEFTKSLPKNKTYLVVIGTDLKDVRGGNPITSPFSFAFSTGNKIDHGKISGKVYSDNYERVKVLAYIKNGKSEDKLNPGKSPPDYIIQVSPDGSYQLTNLPAGDYRVFVITDEDRNNFYDKDFDKISVPSKDFNISPENNSLEEVNFILNDFELNKFSKDFIKLLVPDSINYIFANISNEKKIPPDYKFYFYFKNNKTSKGDIVNNFSITDSSIGKSYRTVFNWLSDSIVEVFSIEKFSPTTSLKITINLNNTVKKYLYISRFNVAGNNDFGKLSGKIISNEKINEPVYVQLYNKENKFISYSQKMVDTNGFIFNEVVEGTYFLISFIDENEDGKQDKGTYYPFKPAERFIAYEKELKIKRGWNMDNVFLKY